MKITPDLFILEVITYISGLVDAYMRVGIAKLNPIYAALYPNCSKCKANIGCKNVTAAYTNIYEINPIVNLGIKKTDFIAKVF